MKQVNLTNGYIALVDDEDFDRVSHHKWCATKNRRAIYAQTTVNGRTVTLHRFIFGKPAGYCVDHINQDGLDCTRKNLRLASNQENCWNRHHLKGSSCFKGVSWNAKERKWRSQITAFGKRLTLGRFSDEKEAARLYDFVARQVFGPFAYLNGVL